MTIRAGMKLKAMLWSPKAVVGFLKVAVSCLLLYWLFQRVTWSDMASAWLQLNWAVIGLAFLAYLSASFISVLRWFVIARGEGFMKQTLVQFCEYYAVGLYFNLLLPTSIGGDAVKAFYLAGEWEQYPRALGTILIDRLTGLLVLIVTLGFVSTLSTWLPLAVRYGGLVVLLMALLLPLLLARIVAWLARHNFSRRITAWSEIGRHLSRKEWLLILALAAVVQFFGGLMYFLVALGLGASFSWTQLALFYTLSVLIAALPVSVNGIGLREAVAVFFFSQLGMAAGKGLAFGLSLFMFFLIGGLMGGIIYLFVPRDRAPMLELEREVNAN